MKVSYCWNWRLQRESWEIGSLISIMKRTNCNILVLSFIYFCTDSTIVTTTWARECILVSHSFIRIHHSEMKSFHFSLKIVITVTSLRYTEWMQMRIFHTDNPSTSLHRGRTFWHDLFGQSFYSWHEMYICNNGFPCKEFTLLMISTSYNT